MRMLDHAGPDCRVLSLEILETFIEGVQPEGLISSSCRLWPSLDMYKYLGN